MTKLQTIYHKKNELFEVEFYKDKECTEDFDFTNAKNLYIEPKNGDCTPIFALSHKLSGLGIKARIFTPIWHLGWYDGISPQTPVVTLNDVLCNDELKNVNLSKYIPEDNAVLFLSEEDRIKFVNDNIFSNSFDLDSFYKVAKFLSNPPKKITIFLPHGTQSELQKADEVGKYLWENFGIKPNLCALHCFTQQDYILNIYGNCLEDSCLAEDVCNFNKIITTNSTGILKPEDSTERLQVIDCKEIFEEYLNKSNLI